MAGDLPLECRSQGCRAHARSRSAASASANRGREHRVVGECRQSSFQVAITAGIEKLSDDGRSVNLLSLDGLRSLMGFEQPQANNRSQDHDRQGSHREFLHSNHCQRLSSHDFARLTTDAHPLQALA
jgi:hypothetical protein